MLIVALIPAVAITEVPFLPVFEVAMVVLVAAAVDGSLSVPRPLIWLGGISYSLYLWHFVVLWAFHWQDRLLAVAVSVVAAYASTVWIERPFRLKRQASPRRPVPIPAPTVS